MQKRVVNHFDGRGLEQLLEPWRCVRGGVAGVFWNRGDAARRWEPREFYNRPQGTRRSGNEDMLSAPDTMLIVAPQIFEIT